MLPRNFSQQSQAILVDFLEERELSHAVDNWQRNARAIVKSVQCDCSRLPGDSLTPSPSRRPSRHSTHGEFKRRDGDQHKQIPRLLTRRGDWRLLGNLVRGERANEKQKSKNFNEKLHAEYFPRPTALLWPTTQNCHVLHCVLAARHFSNSFHTPESQENYK